MNERPSSNAYLQTRAAVARRLIREGVLEPMLALYVVWPTAGVARAEQTCPDGTIVNRAYSTRANQ